MLKQSELRFKAWEEKFEKELPDWFVAWKIIKWVAKNCIVPAIFGILVTGAYTNLPWGECMIITLLIIGVCILALSFYKDFKISGKRVFHSWWLVVVILISFVIRVYYFEPKTTERMANVVLPPNQDGQNSTTAESVFTLNAPGESPKLHAKDALHADFAGSYFHISSIGIDRPDAQITVSDANGSFETYAPPKSPFWTNQFNKKTYIASLSGGSILNPAWIMIKIDEQGTASQVPDNQEIGDKKNDVIQFQNITIQSLQIENSKLNRQINDFEFERDRSAEAVKKRTLILAGQIIDFLSQWETNAPSPDTEEERQTWIRGDTHQFSEAFMKNGDAEIAYSQKEDLAFTKAFIGRLSTIQSQLADLGLKTPKLDYLLNGPPHLSFEIRDVAEEIESVANHLSTTTTNIDYAP